MLCFVTLPNRIVIEVDVAGNAKGQELLDKVCQQLGIIETDYFGLKFHGRKGEHLWLNTRNPLGKQLTGLTCPHRLKLQVKFFVQPHFLLQENTRALFYQQVKQEFAEGIILINDRNTILQCTAIIAQIELGDAIPGNVFQQTSYSIFLPESCKGDDKFLSQVAEHHVQLKDQSLDTLQYRLLKLASEQECYGVQRHEVKNTHGDIYEMGVGPKGISLYQNEILIQRITYPIIQKATHAGKYVFLHTHKEDGSVIILGFKLVSDRAANGLYRCVTEMHSFYRCDTVRSTVSSQYSRDLKGTLASLFNENTSTGKKYVFDIQRTCREAYDHARRQLYNPSISLLQPHISDNLNKLKHCDDNQTDNNDNEDIKVLREKLEQYHEAFLCRICMDTQISVAFQPCGHVVCCASCSQRLELCPVCRSAFDQVHHVFLPIYSSLSSSSTSNANESELNEKL